MGAQTIILKFGSSVLKRPDDAATAVTEIMRWHKDRAHVVAVVSAIGSDTDDLIARADRFQTAPVSAARARLISLGEDHAAALLALAADRVGLAVKILEPEAAGFRAEGPRHDAELSRVNASAIRTELAEGRVVIVPGFVGLDAEGDRVLLGRGGSDLTALFLGKALNADRIRLIKDEDGVYDRDPAEVEGEAARRFAALSWDCAAAVSKGLIQPKALEYARAKRIVFELTTFGQGTFTKVCEYDAPPPPQHRVRPLRVAIAGCGVVGGGVLQRCLAEPDRFEVTRVLVRDVDAHIGAGVNPGLLIDQPDALLSDNADMLAEALTGTETACQLHRTAIEKGVDIVTANKQAISTSLQTLKACADKAGVMLRYSPSVGGGTPMVEAVHAVRRSGTITKIEGVLTGTANFVLDRLAAGDDLSTAVQAAQNAGLAEADPSDDLTGRDAAAKLQILAFEAFGIVLARDEIRCDPINDQLAGFHGGCRQISRLQWRGGDLVGSVAVENRPEDDPFRMLKGAQCGLVITKADGSLSFVKGLGAGRWPTAESMMAELGDVYRSHAFNFVRNEAKASRFAAVG